MIRLWHTWRWWGSAWECIRCRRRMKRPYVPHLHPLDPFPLGVCRRPSESAK